MLKRVFPRKGALQEGGRAERSRRIYAAVAARGRPKALRVYASIVAIMEP